MLRLQAVFVTAKHCISSTKLASALIPPGDSGVFFEPTTDDLGSVLAQDPIVRGKSGQKVAVNIELTDDFVFNKDGHNDFRFGFSGAREVSRVGVLRVRSEDLSPDESSV